VIPRKLTAKPELLLFNQQRGMIFALLGTGRNILLFLSHRCSVVKEKLNCELAATISEDYTVRLSGNDARDRPPVSVRAAAVLL